MHTQLSGGARALTLCPSIYVCQTMCGSRGGTGGSGPPPPEKNHKNIGFLSKTGQDLLKNHKTTKPALNIGPSSARQWNAILMVLLAGRRWPNFSGIWIHSLTKNTHTQTRSHSWTSFEKDFLDVRMRPTVCAQAVKGLARLLNLSLFARDVPKSHEITYFNRDIWFPTMWYFDKCRLRQACAAIFSA